MSSEDKRTTSSNLGDLVSGITPGVKNIEAAYSRAGASSKKTPGAGAKMGSQEQAGANAHQGLESGSSKYTSSIGNQRVEPSVVGKMFNNLMNGAGSSK
ncbi:hypothetical protein LOCC1_G000694 [Lachnellula occidentalis]|uniref:Uncharacterized protein n=1 Tax=Lachnellula occidentalis TaxID=215460 RepID=A0A8H8S8X2_9HELO|nr:hypothetical protein LOCC1_G000694 [Lachnellula occidentalis]